MNIFCKYIKQLVTWWKITNVAPSTKQLNKMLNSAFSCFGIGLFLLLLFDPKQEDSFYLVQLSFISLLIAFLPLVAVSLNKRSQAFFTGARLIDDTAIIAWVFMLTPIVTLKRLIDIWNKINSDLIPDKFIIYYIALLCIAIGFFIAYFIIMLWLQYHPIKQQSYLQSMQVSFYQIGALLSFTWVSILFANIWATPFKLESYVYEISLIIAAILLIKLIKKVYSNKTWLYRTLGTILISIVLIIFKYALSEFPYWLWISLVTVFISFVLLLIGNSRFDRENKFMMNATGIPPPG